MIYVVLFLVLLLPITMIITFFWLLHDLLKIGNYEFATACVEFSEPWPYLPKGEIRKHYIYPFGLALISQRIDNGDSILWLKVNHKYKYLRYRGENNNENNS